MQSRNLLAYLCIFGDAVLYFDAPVCILDEAQKPIRISGIRAKDIIETSDSVSATVILRNDIRSEDEFTKSQGRLWLGENDVCAMKIDDILSKIISGKIKTHIPGWWKEPGNLPRRRKLFIL